MAIEKADLVVIGAGAGGLSVAAGAAQLGLKVVLFERGEMGGDCLNYGCVPSKALIAAAKRVHAIRMARAFGIEVGAPQVHWPEVHAHIHNVIETIAPIDSQERFEGLGVKVIREHARFTGRDTVQSPSAHVRARRIVIAAGGRAVVPPVPGLADLTLTNESVFHLDRLPERLIVLGGGVIGVELAQAFNRLGSAVTVVEAATPLARFDPEITAVLLDRLRAEGVQLLTGAKATAVDGQVGALNVHLDDGRVLAGSHVLTALGRAPNTEGLDLAAAGIAFTGRGITTDAYLRSSNPKVFAVGDIAGKEQLTHAAGWHASAFVRTTLFKSATRADSVPMPSALYGDPELAQIGLTEAEAIAKFGQKAITVTRIGAHDNDRAQAERQTEGLVKLVIGPGGKLLGAAIAGEGAAEQLQLVGLAMSNKLGVRALTNMIAPYPTRGEQVKRAASAYFTPLVFGPGARRLVRLLQRLP